MGCSVGVGAMSMSRRDGYDYHVSGARWHVRDILCRSASASHGMGRFGTFSASTQPDLHKRRDWSGSLMDPPWGVYDSHGSLWDRCRPTWRGECRTRRRGSKRRAETSGTLPHPGVGVGDCLRISRQRPALRTSSCSPASPGCRLLLGLPATCPPQDLPTWRYTVRQALPPSARHRGIPPANRTAQLSCRGGPRLAEWLASMSAYVLATVPCALFDLESTEGYWPVVVTVRARVGVLRQVRRCAWHHPKVHTFGWELGPTMIWGQFELPLDV